MFWLSSFCLRTQVISISGLSFPEHAWCSLDKLLPDALLILGHPAGWVAQLAHGCGRELLEPVFKASFVMLDRGG